MRRIPILAAVLTILVANPLRAGDDPVPEGDLARLQGQWKTTTVVGKPVTILMEIRNKAVTFTFKDDKGKQTELKGELAIDEKPTPKTVDWLQFTLPNGDNVDKNLGIYELNGDSLKVCNAGPRKPRPTEFEDGDNGAPPSLFLFERVKE